jgi:hypothetical protein
MLRRFELNRDFVQKERRQFASTPRGMMRS